MTAAAAVVPKTEKSSPGVPGESACPKAGIVEGAFEGDAEADADADALTLYCTEAE